MRHLPSHQQTFLSEVDSTKPLCRFRGKASRARGGKVVSQTSSSPALNRAVAALISCTELPLKLCSKRGFNHFKEGN